MPLPSYEGDEIYRNGIFKFNVSRILEHIVNGKLNPETEYININEWLKIHGHGSVNEEHLPTVDTTKPILQAEIRPGRFEIIDGNHRFEKTYREGVAFIYSYKLTGEQLIPFFTEKRGYETFVEYWNSKLKPV